MLYIQAKKDATEIWEKARDKYNAVCEEMNYEGEALYNKRLDCVALIGAVESLVNSIANTPKEFERKIADIRKERANFHDREEYAKRELDAAKKAGLDISAGIAGGAAVASLTPTAAMWVATTFGTSSTGTAISALSGAAATKAALAWLGGGALAAGGAGMAQGQALLALAGPIGWGITAAITTGSVIRLGMKNKEICDDLLAEAKTITLAGAQTRENVARIRQLAEETELISDGVRGSLSVVEDLNGMNYEKLTEMQQRQLGTMVNNTLSMANMLTRTL